MGTAPLDGADLMNAPDWSDVERRAGTASPALRCHSHLRDRPARSLRPARFGPALYEEGSTALLVTGYDSPPITLDDRSAP